MEMTFFHLCVQITVQIVIIDTGEASFAISIKENLEAMGKVGRYSFEGFIDML